MLNAPQFRLVKNSSGDSFAETLAALWESDSPVQTEAIVHMRAWPRDHRAGPGILTSIFVHFALIFFLVRVPISLYFPHHPAVVQADELPPAEQVEYTVQPIDLSKFLPALQEYSTGAATSDPNPARLIPSSSSAAVRTPAALVSAPPHPDNNHQTILQPAFPSDKKIIADVRLPNLLIPSPSPAKPSSPANAITIPEPSLAATEPPATGAALLVPSPKQPVAPVLPVTAAAAKPAQTKTKAAARLADMPAIKVSPASVALLSLSIDAALPASSVSVPAGNRSGEFAISGAGGSNSQPTAGAAEPKAPTIGGGHWGISLGLGESAGGNGLARDALSNAALRIIAGPHGTNEKVEDLVGSVFAAPVIYPVPTPSARHMAVTITAGPTGGGGLPNLGVLSGRKVYTIYLPTASASWIFQFCAHSPAPSESPNHSAGVAIAFDSGVVPPSPFEQFDFRRTQIPSGFSGGMIILQGVLGDDGSVRSLSLLQGMLHTLDQAALAAFAQWRFNPALRDNQPIAVDFLVGIPLNPAGF